MSVHSVSVNRFVFVSGLVKDQLSGVVPGWGVGSGRSNPVSGLNFTMMCIVNIIMWWVCFAISITLHSQSLPF